MGLLLSPRLLSSLPPLVLLGSLLGSAGFSQNAWATSCTIALTSPAQNSTQSQSPPLRWTGNCAQYRVYYSPSGTFGADLVRSSWQIYRTYTMPEGAWDGYQGGDWSAGVYWKVQGRAWDGTLSFSWTTRRMVMDPDLDDDGFSIGEGMDCDDGDDSVHPGAAEVCNEKDEDCDGALDDGLPFTFFFPDADGDGWGQQGVAPVVLCDGPHPGQVTTYTDCDDLDSEVSPEEPEVCDGVDQDCDGLADQGLSFLTWYPDVDMDGYGDADPRMGTDTCDGPPPGWVEDHTDCDDGDGQTSPDGIELCDGIDNDCSGEEDQDLEKTLWSRDLDEDGYGTELDQVYLCYAPSGYIADDTDCDDSTSLAHPGLEEVCLDGLDNDCDGTAGECLPTGEGLLADADVLFHATAAGQQVGFAVAALGDLNKDGYQDFALGVPGYDGGAGASSGAAFIFRGPLEGNDLDITAAFAVLLGQNAGDQAGTAVAAAGDVNGDDFPDLLVGAPYHDGNGANSGAVYVVSGLAQGTVNLSSAYARWQGPDSSDRLGAALSTAGDVDFDGQDDLWLGAPDDEENGPTSGSAFLVLGSYSGVRNVANLAVARIYGANSTDTFGFSISGGLDINGDGDLDVLAGSPRADGEGTDSGRAFIFYGPVDGTRQVDEADVIVEGIAAGDNLGRSVALLPDANGDGYDDFLVGAPSSDIGAPDTGAAYLFLGSYGRTGSLPPSSAWARYVGAEESDKAGAQVASVGDVDGDGYPEIGLGAPEAVDPLGVESGLLYVASPKLSPGLTYLADAGADPAMRVLHGSMEDDRAGASLAGADINGDGYADLLVGATWADEMGDLSGIAYLLWGEGW